MKTALLLFALAAGMRAQLSTAPAATAPAAPSAAAADTTVHAFVEIAVPRATCFVGERVDVRVRIGYDAAFFRASGIPLFRREVDVPLRLRAPWLRELAGAAFPGAAGAPQPPGSVRLSLAVNDGVVDAARVGDRVLDGRTFTVVELVRPVIATRAGPLTIPEATADYAFATRFTDDMFSGRVAADRHDAHVAAAPVTLTVAPLPDAGRPPGFSGAVGHFTATADSDRSSATVGTSMRLRLHITGDGNLALIDPPRLAAIEGFRILGMIDAHGSGDRTVTFDVSPQSASLTAIPALPFSFFDPEPPGAYRTIFTTPIPLVVDAATAVAQARSVPEAPRVSPPPESPAESPSRWPIAVLAALCAVVGVVIAQLRARRVDRDARDPAGARARGAAVAFQAAVSRSAAAPNAAAASAAAKANANASLADIFADYLAAHLRCAAPAVITADLASRLTAAGASPADSVAAARLLDELTHARYGGPPPADAAARASALVAALNSALLAGRRPSA